MNSGSLTAHGLMSLPFAYRQSAIAGLVVSNLRQTVRERIFPGIPESVVDRLISNPRMRSRIIRLGVSERLPMPESDLSHNDAAYLTKDNDGTFDSGTDKSVSVLVLLFKLSRLKGILGRDDVRALIKVAGEEELAFGWSNVQLRQKLAVDPNLEAMSENEYPAFATKIMQIHRFNEAQWWSHWVHPPEKLPGALKEAAIAASEWELKHQTVS